jgi:hypothetical protein
LAALGYLDEAREAAFELPERNLWGDSLRAKALTFLAQRYAETGDLRAGVDCALSVGKDDDRSDALAAYADIVAVLPPAELLPAVRAVLDRAATLSRQALLTDLAAFAPVIARVGGQQAIEDIVTAVEAVTRWWP